MHRGFKLSLDWENEHFYQKGLDKFETNRSSIKKTLHGFAGKDGVLKGSQLQSNWLPQVKADVFISHSHQDERLAVSIAGWLQEKFGLEVFIDSCIWGYADDLLWLIDNNYCLNPSGETYSYEKRNQSTSHVHMMLSTALSMMIDKAECLFFLNTPNTIQTTDATNKTQSPWIYNEISMSAIIRKRKLSEYRREFTKAFSSRGRMNESEMINYEVNLSHLQYLTGSDLDKWEKRYEEVSLHEKYPLNKLYELFPVDKII